MELRCEVNGRWLKFEFSCDWSDLGQFEWLRRIPCSVNVDWEFCCTHCIKITGNGYFTSMFCFLFFHGCNYLKLLCLVLFLPFNYFLNLFRGYIGSGLCQRFIQKWNKHENDLCDLLSIYQIWWTFRS